MLIFCSFSRYLEDKTVILVTHQLQFIKSVEQIVVMEKGKVLAEGNYKELQVRPDQI